MNKKRDTSYSGGGVGQRVCLYFEMSVESPSKNEKKKKRKKTCSFYFFALFVEVFMNGD
jgi:hypothetical protein